MTMPSELRCPACGISLTVSARLWLKPARPGGKPTTASSRIAQLMASTLQPSGWTLTELAQSTGLKRPATEKAAELLVRRGQVRVIRKRGRGNENLYFWNEDNA